MSDTFELFDSFDRKAYLEVNTDEWPGKTYGMITVGQLLGGDYDDAVSILLDKRSLIALATKLLTIAQEI